LTSIIRERPLASHGLAKEPDPVDPLGQSCCVSGALDAVAGGAIADGAGAEIDAAAAALAEAGGAGALPSLEQPTKGSITMVDSSAFRIRRMLDEIAPVRAMLWASARLAAILLGSPP
jgi:hypothetical protein